MFNTYRDKFNEFKGKVKKSKFDSNQKKYEWKDYELIDKIVTLNNWKEVDWFKPPRNDDFMMMNRSLPDEDTRKMELLKPLVKKGKEIFKEESKLKEKEEEELKKLLKRQEAMKLKTYHPEKSDDLHDSKYPVDKAVYDRQTKIEEDKTKSKLELDESSVDMNSAKVEGVVETHFMQAYKKITKEEIDKEKKKIKKYGKWISAKYTHPGTYVKLFCKF